MTSMEQRFMDLCRPRVVSKREPDPTEEVLIEKMATECLRIINDCTDSGMRVRGITKHMKSGNCLWRLSLQMIEENAVAPPAEETK